MDLTIIIPAYNAEQFIQNNVQGLINRFNNSEIIVVDDGSNDKTFDKLSTLADKIKIIKHSQNLGKGAAIRSGFFSASGDIVIFTDADLPYGLDNIEKLYWQLKNSQNDVVIGYRHRFKESFFRHLTHLAINVMIEVLFLWNIYDTQCGLKGFKKNFIDEIKTKMRVNNFTVDIEILHLAKIKNKKIERFPVTMSTKNSVTTIKFKDTIIMFFDILKIRFNKNYF
mgnify:CR=1 FL=1